MTRAHFEPLAGVIRIWLDGSKGWGQPFDFALAVAGDEGVATLKALHSENRPLPVSAAKAVAKVLREAGFKKVRWTRKKNGQNRVVTLNL